jgi:hypothetical protein
MRCKKRTEPQGGQDITSIPTTEASSRGVPFDLLARIQASSPSIAPRRAPGISRPKTSKRPSSTSTPSRQLGDLGIPGVETIPADQHFL